MVYELSKTRKEYLAALEKIREEEKNLRKKHSTRVYKGFCKMCKRQDEKLNDVSINLPVAIKLPKSFKGEYIHCINVSNNKWNGMNLKTLCSQTFDRHNCYKSPFYLNPLTGKYSLSIAGKTKLKKLREKRNNQKLT